MSIEVSKRLRRALLLKAARDGRHITDAEVAREVWNHAGLRVPPASTVSRYLNGGRQVPLELVSHFADYLGADLRWVLTGEGEPPGVDGPPDRWDEIRARLKPRPTPPGAVDAAEKAARRRAGKGGKGRKRA